MNTSVFSINYISTYVVSDSLLLCPSMGIWSLGFFKSPCFVNKSMNIGQLVRVLSISP